MACEYCNSYPHLVGCPNEDPLERIHDCEICGHGIYPGQIYMRVDDDIICEDCLSDVSAKEILEFLGYKQERANQRE